MDIREHNRITWDMQVKKRNIWTIPVNHDFIQAARNGNWEIVLTPTKPIPHDWLPDLKGKKLLCLASGGGQQAPVLAAAGAKVTVLDNSPAQLAQDRLVAERERLEIATVEGDMRDLNMFPDQNFDYIVHPVSNCFVPDVRPVWKEAFRVLRPQGILIAGFSNPANYLFDYDLIQQTGELKVKYSLPYSDVEILTQEQKERYLIRGDPFDFSHTLEEQIGGQIEAGFMITGFFEDRDYLHSDELPLNKYMSTFIATRAVKLT